MHEHRGREKKGHGMKIRGRDLSSLQGWARFIGFVSVVTAAASFYATATPKDSPSTVDLELVLAVDASASMSAIEQRVQRDGYINALRNPDVLRAIESGPRGRIALAYIEWAGPYDQRVLAPLTVIDGPGDAAVF